MEWIIMRVRVRVRVDVWVSSLPKTILYTNLSPARSDDNNRVTQSLQVEAGVVAGLVSSSSYSKAFWVKTDTADPHISFFHAFFIAALSKPATYSTHNAARPQQFEIGGVLRQCSGATSLSQTEEEV